MRKLHNYWNVIKRRLFRNVYRVSFKIYFNNLRFIPLKASTISDFSRVQIQLLANWPEVKHKHWHSTHLCPVELQVTPLLHEYLLLSCYLHQEKHQCLLHKSNHHPWFASVILGYFPLIINTRIMHRVNLTFWLV